MAKTPRNPHSGTKREPVTIDLDADEVKREVPEKAEEPATEQPAAPQEQASQETQDTGAAEPASGEGPRGEEAETAPAGQVPPASRPSGGGRALAAGLVGGVVAVGLAGALQWSGVLPVPGGTDNAALDALRQEVQVLRGEIAQARNAASDSVSRAALEEALSGPQQDIAALRDAVSALREAAPGDGGQLPAALAQRLSAIEERLSQLSQAADQGAAGTGLADRLAAVEADVESLSAAVSAARQSGAEGAERLEALSGRLSALEAEVEARDEGPRLALMAAATALRAAVDRGAPFAGELETYAALAPDAPALAALRPYAETGIPTRADLAREASEAASRIAAAAAAPPEDAGFFDRLLASARRAVTVRPVGEVEGETPAAIAARMEQAAIEGDYARALAEYEMLPPALQGVASGFAERLRARRSADRILEEALSAALKPA